MIKLDIASKQEVSKTLPLLVITRKIVDEDRFAHEVWVWMKDQYSNINEADAIGKLVCSVINAILTQERICFAISRRGLQELLKNDKNFNTVGLGFNNNIYPTIIAKLHEWGIVKTIHESTGYSATGYEVIEEGLLAHLGRKVDRNTQYVEVLKFCEEYSKKSTSSKEEPGSRPGLRPGSRPIKGNKDTNGINGSKESKGNKATKDSKENNLSKDTEGNKAIKVIEEKKDIESKPKYNFGRRPTINN